MWGVTDRVLYVPLPGNLRARTWWASRTELIIEIDENLGRLARHTAVLRARRDAKQDRPPAGHSKGRTGPFLALPGMVLARRLAGAANSATGMHIAVATFTAAGAVAAGVAITTTPSHHHHAGHHHPAAAITPPAAARTPRRHPSPLTDGHGSHHLRHHARPSPTTAPSPAVSPPPSRPGLLPTSVPLPSLPSPLGGLLPTSLPLPPVGKVITPALRDILHGLTG
jgi:hypothetical protein